VKLLFTPNIKVPSSFFVWTPFETSVPPKMSFPPVGKKPLLFQPPVKKAAPWRDPNFLMGLVLPKERVNIRHLCVNPLWK